MLQKQLRKFVVFMAKVALLTAESETSFVSVICHWKMNPDQDTHQTLIKMFYEN